VLWLPGAALRALFGGVADAALQSQRAVPDKLTAAGFLFDHPGPEPALRFLLGRATGAGV
jgi:NAD dependent epimerase/dehydratase family enzyme